MRAARVDAGRGRADQGQQLATLAGQPLVGRVQQVEQGVDDLAPVVGAAPAGELGLHDAGQVPRQHMRLVGDVDAVDLRVEVTTGVEPTLQLLGDEALEEPLEERVLVSVPVGHAGSLADGCDRCLACPGCVGGWLG